MKVELKPGCWVTVKYDEGKHILSIKENIDDIEERESVLCFRGRRTIFNDEVSKVKGKKAAKELQDSDKTASALEAMYGWD